MFFVFWMLRRELEREGPLSFSEWAAVLIVYSFFFLSGIFVLHCTHSIATSLMVGVPFMVVFFVLLVLSEFLTKCRRWRHNGGVEVIRHDDVELQEECAVCLERMKIGERARRLDQCGHRFHAKCVDKWLRRSETCPLCRQSLSFVDSLVLPVPCLEPPPLYRVIGW